MRSLTRCLAAAVFLCAFAPLASAQPWPAKPIRLIVGFPPGSFTDVVTRALSAQLSQSLGQPVVVENRPGAAGNIATEAVAKSAPDGYTLVHSPGSTMVINPLIYKLNFDIEKDLDPVAPTMRTNIILVVRQDSPARNLVELLALIRANPGKLNYGSAGSGSSMHVATEMLLRGAKVQATHVPYRGAADSLAALLAGDLDFAFDPGTAVPQIKAGKLRPIAVARPTRSPFFPDTPTMAEAGVDVDMDLVFGIYARAGTPREIVTRLNREVVRIMQTAEVGAALAAFQSEWVGGSPEEFAARQRHDRERIGVIVREAKIRVE